MSSIRIGWDHPVISMQVWRHLLLLLKLLLLRLNLLLLLLGLETEVCDVLLCPLQRMRGKVSSANARKDQRNHGRRDAALEGLSQHSLLNTPLIQSVPFLAGLFLLLLPAIFFGLCVKPTPH